MKLQEEALLEEIHELQSRVGFGNPSFWSVLYTKIAFSTIKSLIV